MIGDPFWQRIDTNTLITHALQTRPTMTFGADDTPLGALSPKELSRVMMGTPKDGKVAIAKFGLIAEDNTGKAGKTAEGERAIWILKQRRTVYPEHVGTAIAKVRCFWAHANHLLRSLFWEWRQTTAHQCVGRRRDWALHRRADRGCRFLWMARADTGPVKSRVSEDRMAPSCW